MYYKSICGIFLILLTGCSQRYNSPPESPCYMDIMVDACHHDYRNAQTFIRSMKRCHYYGHAWVKLCNRGEVFEGSQTGEFGVDHALYFDGIMNYIEYGYANPEPNAPPRHEPNPVKYLWESQQDGKFEKGSGGHKPTYAVRVNLTDDEYRRIIAFIRRYDFKDYSITGNQCVTFTAQVAAIGGLDLEDKITVPVNRVIRARGENFQLWEDEDYSTITFSSPDMLEKSMKRAVLEGRARKITR